MANRWICLTDDEIDSIRFVLGYDLIESAKTAKIVVKLNKSQKRITIASAKGKGRELQKWVCERISKILDIPYNQQDDNCLIHAREMGQAGVDVVLRGEARTRFPFAVECKSTENLSLTSTIKQAQSNESDNTEWMIVHRCKVLRDPIVIISWDAFEKAWKQIDSMNML